MNSKEIDTYSKLASAGKYFLDSAFKNLELALLNECETVYFIEELKKVNPKEFDEIISKKDELPLDNIELLRLRGLTISGKTMNHFMKALNEAKSRSENENCKFRLNHEINSIEILGHLNNFGFFIETIINRHLLFLKDENSTNSIIYNRISIAKIMERIIYIFKDELNTNKIQINEIINLFALRNKTVHFTPENAIAIKPKISELFQIYKQCIKVITILEKKENFNESKFSIELENKMLQIKTKWT